MVTPANERETKLVLATSFQIGTELTQIIFCVSQAKLKEEAEQQRFRLRRQKQLLKNAIAKANMKTRSFELLQDAVTVDLKELERRQQAEQEESKKTFK